MELLSTLDRDRIAGLLERDEYFWLDLESPGDEDVERLREIFGFHPLAIEDTLKFDQRPKLDDYDDYAFVVFYAARNGEQGIPELIEVHHYISGSYVVTVHREHCDELAQLRKSLARREVRSEQQLVYRVFDSLTDSFFPVLGAIDDEIDTIEGSLVDSADREAMYRIQVLRRALVSLRRAIAPQRDMFARHMDDIVLLPGLQTDTRDYFRDVYDHLLRAAEQIDSYRDLLSGLMDVYLSSVSNRLNSVTERLTLIATIFLPLAVITGFFGQNFGWMVRNINSQADFVIFGVGGQVLAIVALLGFFKARGWI